jgi:uncharacterized membrane protein YdjX (TVP38/TMEM64 family)
MAIPGNLLFDSSQDKPAKAPTTRSKNFDRSCLPAGVGSESGNLRSADQRIKIVTQKQRWILIAVAFIALYALGRALGLDHYLDAAHLREAVTSAGAFGPVVFVSIFVGIVLAQVPGIPFILIAPALFHWPMAVLVSFVGSNLAVLLNFEIVRRIGGNALTRIDNPRLQKILDSLDAHPIRAVFLLRLITIMLPPVTGALALTNVSRRDHAVGSVLGMMPPIILLLLLGGLAFHSTH